jgi:hypothetical protein
MYLSLRFWKNRCKDLLLAMGISALWATTQQESPLYILLPFLPNFQSMHARMYALLHTKR